MWRLPINMQECDMRIKRVFKKRKNIVIGALHLLPLPGYRGFVSLENVMQKAKIDFNNFVKGGVDAVIVENNYDLPHRIKVEPETTASMTLVVSLLRQQAKIPIGVSVLWNDYKAALSIAKACGVKFIRVPVFVDKVSTSYGVVEGNSKDVINFRKEIKAEDILLLTDIHVKHSKLISNNTIEQSAMKAMKRGSEAIIITGKWTADSPKVDDLERVRAVVGEFPIIVGSGANELNIRRLLSITNGAIVGTSLKDGKDDKRNVNIRHHKNRISLQKVKAFMKKVNKR